MGQTAMRAAVCVALVSASLVTGGPTAFAGTSDEAVVVEDLVAPVPAQSPTGTYIVLLDEEPAATYDGGEPGLPATAPEAGATLDTHSPRVKKYTAFLEERQRDVAEEAGIEPLATYQVVLNGFSAEMAPDAAARVAGLDGVLAVYPDEIFRPNALSRGGEVPAKATATTPVAGTGGAGVVVGVIDTGIAPGNPSFAGDRLRTARGADPYLVGETVVFDKADGQQFRSTRVTADGWTRADSSTKVIAAQFFAAGATAAGFDFSTDVLSPQDRDGHGSRVAGVAAGNAEVQVTVDGDDFGAISGVAPEAKIASYKACYAGDDPLSTADDICVASDVLAALDRAVADGVDAVAFSLGAAPSPWGADDIAFANAAAAGVFIAVSAGNGGPGASTAQGGAPWYTTVAASTSPGFETTVSLSDGFAAPGVSASVRAGEPVSAPVVYAADAALGGSADAHLCYQGTLDPELVAGKIVVCDRGTNPRSEKSREVADAGGVGMILVNVSPDSLDAEFDAVPTVHIDSAQRDALLAAVRSRPSPTATLGGEGLADTVISAPQIAGFSGRGPIADGDILTPDVSAPGVAVLSPTQDSPEGEPTWGIASGTSLAAPHVAGLAARYLAVTPGATPDEIKSALMTTATDTVNADGSADVDPFAQGAGQADGDRLLDPGLLYLNGQAQWRGYLHAQGHGGDVPPTFGDLNLASISIGQLGQRQTVTRAVTATRAGTYEAAASIPGVEVTVSPASLTFAGAGDTQRFTVTFAASGAPVEQWATGYLTWTGDDGTSVRSPLAVRPVTVSATTLVTAEGMDGSAAVQLVSGVTGELNVRAVGLAPLELLVDPQDPAPGHSGDAASGDANGRIAWVVPVPAGVPLAEFTLAASDASVLDLAVYRLTSPSDQRYDQRWESTADSGEERVALIEPAPGSYLVVVDLSEAAEGMTWDLTSAVVSAASRSLAVTPESLTATAGDEVPLALSWEGLHHDTRYLGVIEYADSAARTTVRIDAGAPRPVADAPPTVTGDARLGEVLTVDPGTWGSDDTSFAYQWLRDGEPIDGADAADYRVRIVDAGAALTAQVTARQPGNVNAGTALSEPIVVDAASTVTVTMNRSVGTTADRYAVTVAVRTALGQPAEGTVSVSVDATEYVGTLAEGQVTFTLPAQSRGIHVVVADYSGGPGVSSATGVSGFVVRG